MEHIHLFGQDMYAGTPHAAIIVALESEACIRMQM